MEHFFDITSKDEFQALRAEDKHQPLKDRTNHMLILPRVFELAEGCQAMDTNELAWRIIQEIKSLALESDEDKTAVHNNNDQSAIILLYLWLVAKGLINKVTVLDVGNADVYLDSFCSKIRRVLSNSDPLAARRSDGGKKQISVSFDYSALNATQQELTSVNAMNAAILAQDKDKQDKKSILHGMAPKSRRLFNCLCTSSLICEPPVMPEFLCSLLSEKNPNHISNHMKVLTKNWKGTFIEGAFCCFLAKGYVSLCNSLLLPGRFAILMFIPKECETICDGFRENLEMHRRFWDQDINEETLKRLAKIDLFLPKNVHHLEVQVKTACHMIQELTVKHGVASTLLSKALSFIQKQSAHIARLIEQDRLLAVKVVYTLHMELQHFFELILDHKDPMEDIDEDDTHYASDQLKEWLFDLEVNRVPSIILPLALGGGSLVANNNTREHKEATGSEMVIYNETRCKKRRHQLLGNDNRFCYKFVCPEWKVTVGKQYGVIFTGECIKG